MVLQRLDTDAATEQAVPLDEQHAKLREQLANPKQRAALLNERLQQQRAANPDLARVLRIDAATETKLLALLVDHSLTNALRESSPNAGDGGSVVDLMQQDVVTYDQQIGEITKLLGPQRLDTYLDYDLTRAARQRVEEFAASLTDPNRLKNQQKDALVDLLAEEDARLARGSRLGIGANGVLADVTAAGRSSPQERERRLLLLRIYVNEQMLRQAEAADRQMLERLPQVLSPEQTRAYGSLRAQQRAELRMRTDALRRDAGVESNDLVPADAPRGLDAELRLQIDVSINGNALTRTMTTRGETVSFTGPEGLWVEAEPTLLDADVLSVELRFYESAAKGLRLVGRSLVRRNISNAQSEAAGGFRGFGSMRTVLRGRKALLLDCGVTASYL